MIIGSLAPKAYWRQRVVRIGPFPFWADYLAAPLCNLTAALPISQALKQFQTRKMRCRFCTKEGCPRPAFVDYKDTNNLRKLVSNQGKLFGRKRSQLCAPFQRAVSAAVKRARTMALLPYVGE